MKKVIILPCLLTSILLCLVIGVQAQATATAVALKQHTKVANSENHFVAPTMTRASFAGGKAALDKYITDNLIYPQSARESAVEGNVIASFSINALGEIEKIKIVESPGFGCDEEVTRLLLAAPRWQPANQGNHPVKSNMKIAVRFKLQ